MVLQESPAQAAVFGIVGTLDATASVSVLVTPSSGGGGAYTVAAEISDGRWKALLHPTEATSGAALVTYTIAAMLTCASSGCQTSTVTLSNVVFGSVWFCFGQSNQWLQLKFTYARNASFAAIKQGVYDNIRVASGDSQVNGLSPTSPPTHPWRMIQEAAALDASDSDSLDQFSAACYHFAEAITDQYLAAGRMPPTLGLVATAIGGSMIEEWITNEVAAQCYGASPNANGGDLNHLLWDYITRAYLDMTIEGWLYYQGENNAGSLHGNSLEHAGYGCLMPALVESYRTAWSAIPNTTSPMAPFGIVTLSTADSEGAADIASFRWSQSGNFFNVPNSLLDNVFLAHAYDLSDPWVNCGNQPQTTQCPGCDTADPEINCLQPFYMGPGIHPRLKKPVGQRLAASALSTVYGWGGPVTGPTLSGCTYDAVAGGGGNLSLSINQTLLAGAPLLLQDYDTAYPNRSGFSALINSNGQPGSGNWIALNLRKAGATTLVVDLTPLQGAAPQAIKYAWGSTGGAPDNDDVQCCASLTPAGECLPGLCPIFVESKTAPGGGLPANPFIAQIDAQTGKCVCPLPQVCDA